MSIWSMQLIIIRCIKYWLDQGCRIISDRARAIILGGKWYEPLPNSIPFIDEHCRHACGVPLLRLIAKGGTALPRFKYGSETYQHSAMGVMMKARHTDQHLTKLAHPIRLPLIVTLDCFFYVGADDTVQYVYFKSDIVLRVLVGLSWWSADIFTKCDIPPLYWAS